MTRLERFNKCTVKKKLKGGCTKIDCKLGLWGVDGYEPINVMYEAMNYFRQYESDGEYSSIIGGESAMDKLTNKKAL